MNPRLRCTLCPFLQVEFCLRCQNNWHGVDGEYICEMSGKSNHHLCRDNLALDHDEKWERFLRKCWPFVVKRGPISVHLLPRSFLCKMTKNSRLIIECSFNSNCRRRLSARNFLLLNWAFPQESPNHCQV